MKITICGSAVFVREMEAVAGQLEKLGHKVKSMPVKFVDGDGKVWNTLDYDKFKKSLPFDKPEFLNNHHERIREHFDKVEWSDAILVTNYQKNGVANYIGPNTLMEMGLAFYLGKKIYLLNPVPDTAWKEEILGVRPVALAGDLTRIGVEALNFPCYNKDSLKDYKKWHNIKTNLNNFGQRQLFKQREIWWCGLGLNIGFEQDGKGKAYERPVLILKKFNLEIFLGVPLTTTNKTGKYYFPIGLHGGYNSVAILSQIRLFDAKRLTNKISVLNKGVFAEIKKALTEVNFS